MPSRVPPPKPRSPVADVDEIELDCDDSDADMAAADNSSDIDMPDAHPPPDGDQSQGRPQRSEAERQAYATAMRLERDAELTALQQAWDFLTNPPAPGARLITEATFTPRMLALLGKGRIFLTLARQHGMSNAAKMARKHFKRRGMTWTGAQQELFDARLLYNERVMAQ